MGTGDRPGLKLFLAKVNKARLSRLLGLLGLLVSVRKSASSKRDEA
jgi:hypothetical protein